MESKKEEVVEKKIKEEDTCAVVAEKKTLVIINKTLLVNQWKEIIKQYSDDHDGIIYVFYYIYQNT